MVKHRRYCMTMKIMIAIVNIMFHYPVKFCTGPFTRSHQWNLLTGEEKAGGDGDSMGWG